MIMNLKIMILTELANVTQPGARSLGPKGLLPLVSACSESRQQNNTGRTTSSTAVGTIKGCWKCGVNFKILFVAKLPTGGEPCMDCPYNLARLSSAEYFSKKSYYMTSPNPSVLVDPEELALSQQVASMVFSLE